jgi:hypothetical protein
VPVVADVQPGQERRHGVGVGVVERHAVEAGVAGAPGGLGKEAGARPDMGQVEVAGPLAVAAVERLQLAGRENGLDQTAWRVPKGCPDARLGRPPPAGVPGGAGEPVA